MSVVWRKDNWIYRYVDEGQQVVGITTWDAWLTLYRNNATLPYNPDGCRWLGYKDFLRSVKMWTGEVVAEIE